MPRLKLKPLFEKWGIDLVDSVNDLYIWREMVTQRLNKLDDRIKKLEDRQKLKDQQSRSWEN